MLGFIICSPFSLEARRQTGHALLTEVGGAGQAWVRPCCPLFSPEEDDEVYCITSFLEK